MKSKVFWFFFSKKNFFLYLSVRLVLAAGAAHAQSAEDRLRDALRDTVAQMRAAQDQLAQAQADLQKSQQDKAALQAQLDAATAKAAEAKSAAPPADLAALKAALAASRQQTASVSASFAKLQASYQTLATQAQTQSMQAQTLGHGLQGQTKALETCKLENKQLTDISENILHLYETQDFRGLLLRSYEPLVGRAKVKLENLVQDYDDRIHDQEFIPSSAKP